VEGKLSINLIRKHEFKTICTIFRLKGLHDGVG